MSFLALSRLEKTYPDGTRAVKGIDLAVGEGELVVLLGPSGCGKTTTLRMVAGLELPSAGRVELAGRDVTRERPSQRDVGFVFQFYALYPHLSVRENVAFPLRCVGLPRADVDAAVARVAGRLGIEALLSRRPRQLSGGDQQRVALARAMVREPAVFLMDEPLGTLDADRRLEMGEVIRTQQLETRTTTIYVTHDQEEAMNLADRIVVMRAGEIAQVGTPLEVYDEPASLFVANFVGSPGMNLVPGVARDVSGSSRFRPRDGGEEIELPRPVPAGEVTLGVRPEFVRLDPRGPLGGAVVVDEYLGAYRNLHVDTDLGRLTVRAGAERPFASGEAVRLAFDPQHTRAFSTATGERVA